MVGGGRLFVCGSGRKKRRFPRKEARLLYVGWATAKFSPGRSRAIVTRFPFTLTTRDHCPSLFPHLVPGLHTFLGNSPTV